jgi:hypothetical protein
MELKLNIPFTLKKRKEAGRGMHEAATLVQQDSGCSVRYLDLQKAYLYPWHITK